MPQTLVKNFIHLVFSTRSRYKLITAPVDVKLYAFMAGICRELDSVPIKVGGHLDHVHVLINLSKNMSLSEFMQKLKANSSRWMKRDGGCQTFQWQSGYSGFSVGERAVEVVKTYIEKQAEHHKGGRIDFKEELRKLLTENGMDFDERYLWD